jgi:hypothetical protein
MKYPWNWDFYFLIVFFFSPSSLQKVSHWQQREPLHTRRLQPITQKARIMTFVTYLPAQPSGPQLNLQMHTSYFSINCNYFFFFFGGTEVWNLGFTLAKQMLYCLSHTSGLFCSGYFGDRVLTNYLPRIASKLNPLKSQPPKYLHGGFVKQLLLKALLAQNSNSITRN